MKTNNLLRNAIDDPRHEWSIGTFGAVGEFRWTEDEPMERRDRDGVIERVTGLAGIKIVPRDDARVIAYDSLHSDGETWGQWVVFCLPMVEPATDGTVRRLGPDEDALRAEDRGAVLFDLGVGRGLVQMCARTRDEELIRALDAMEGRSVFDPGSAVNREILRAQPHRVMLSPLGRVEIYTRVPGPGENSPVGPHTHLLPKLVLSGRTHAANAPIPEGMQPVLTLHPRAPWRDAMGQRVPFDEELDESFEGILADFALPEDRAVRAAVEQAVAAGTGPETFAWPQTRRGRAQGRITLRRLARRDAGGVASWRAIYDRMEDQESDGGAEAEEAVANA